MQLFNDAAGNTRGKVLGIYSLLLVFNGAAWLWAIVALRHFPVLLGTAFLAYSFGLPVVATDVGSFREEIVEGRTGFLSKPGDPAELSRAIETYFASDLYRNLKVRRQDIKDYAEANHSWSAVADLTRNAYAEMLGRVSP